VAVPVVVVALALGGLRASSRQLVFHPSSEGVPAAAQVLPGARDVVLETSDGLRLGAWFVPARPPVLGVGVLVAPGNAGDRAGRAPLARALSAAGLSVLLFDYRGYAGNPGRPTEEGLRRDVRAARQALLRESRLPPHRLVYYGESLGAAVAAELAADSPPGALVLRSPFTDLVALGRAHVPFLPVRLLLRDRFEVTEHVRAVGVPVVVVLGTADEVVPPAQSRAVAAVVPGGARLVEVPGARHNDRVLLDGDALVAAVVAVASRVARP
jgi:uncharacterized protein